MALFIIGGHFPPPPPLWRRKLMQHGDDGGQYRLRAVMLLQQKSSPILSSSRHLLTSDRTFATSVYTPGIEDVMSNFHVSTTVAILPLTVYVLGLGFGPVLAAPLSESRGRK